MRVITGIARGMRLKTLEGTDVVRPTAEKIKEAMFSIVQFDLEDAVVLDLFAGSGQLGIEALSRGAAKAYFVDNSPASIAVVKENLRHTKLEDSAVVCNMPNSAFLRTTPAKFDIAFLDPPYGKKLIQRSLPALVNVMSENGIIVCEHEKECRLPEEEGDFKIHKTYKYGQ
ncbi:MAG: 16S rRNA (guanine(966)-N(2))-methyltransferase RsmD, partial [Oscillospiraceae bacterium]|nr:16S rRNA (guanine(966)-N(2))-methyltransferase RsmD [Oscillospiraceae bacterium]